MSDYLWDKSGEPEEDVRQLEELLGGLRFQPRTFEVPATLPVAAPRASTVEARRAPRTFNNFNWPRLAVAASLILMLLTGAWLITSKRPGSGTAQQAKNERNAPNNAPAPPQTTNGATRTQDDQLARQPMNDEGTSVSGGQERRVVAVQAGAKDSSRRRFNAGSLVGLKRLAAPPRQSNTLEVRAAREQMATNAAVGLTPQEREAMQKFMLAMRVTNEKLGYAERQVQGLNESSPQR